MENLKTYEGFLGMGKPKTENLKLVSRILDAWHKKQIQFKHIGDFKTNPSAERLPFGSNVGQDTITYSYITNFEDKEVKINVLCDNYMWAHTAQMFIDGKEIELNGKEQKWIIKKVGKKLKSLDADWSDSDTRNKEEKRLEDEREHQRVEKWKRDHPEEYARRQKEDQRILAGGGDLYGGEDWS